MSRTIVHVCCLLATLLVGCGSSSTRSEPALATGSTAATSGSEVAVEAETEATAARVVQAPVVLRTTIPVPVPQPAIARDALSPALQAVWTHIEEQVALGRPDGPDENTVANVQAWADGAFRTWVDERRDALVETRALLEEVPQEPVHERSMALALWAYAFEDLGAQIAGAPMPGEIATDDELRGIYIESLNDAMVPLGRRAMELYADCQRRLLPLGDESEWLPWRAYCVQRGQELIEGYGFTEDDAEASADD